MPGETHNGMQCNEFEALLFDALDNQLTGAKQERFRAHARVCAQMRTDVRRSRRRGSIG